MKKILFLLAVCALGLSAFGFALTRTKIIKPIPELLASLDEDISEEDLTPENQQEQSKIQVVFALDCTGSMGGLIQAAKDKIWSIATGMSQAQSNPDISFGFVFYRDRGDDFVTKKVQLTNDMDLAYRELMDMRASGGGDTPESVNQALYEAINDFQWDSDEKVFKVVFLVGDAPPHMDYQDDVKYPETCKQAVKKDIIINTIQCGNMRQTTPIWQEIAQRAQGEFLQLEQSGSEVVIHCPHDKEISRLMGIIDDTRIYYGSASERIQQQDKINATEKIKGEASSGVQAKRAEFNYSNSKNKSNYMGRNELITDLEAGKVKLEALQAEQLPENMRKMTLIERKKYVDDLATKRKEAEAKLSIQIKERSAYVEAETMKLGEAAIDNSFSANVHKVVVKQAESKNIIIDKKVKN